MSLAASAQLQLTPIAESFRKVEAWLQRHCLYAYEDLQAGARSLQLELAEQTVGVHFPPDLVAFFREHNGQAGDGPAVFPPFELLDLESAVREWQALARQGRSSLEAFPIASDGRGGVIAVGTGGALPVGTVHEFSADGTVRACSLSLDAWLESQLSLREDTRRSTNSPRDCISSAPPPG
jgi:hypothetical protein